MIVNELTNRYSSLLNAIKPAETPKESEGTSFSDTMNNFIAEVNNSQTAAGELSESFVKGEEVDLHDVMVEGQKAKTSFQLLMELRNKGLDLYREVLRMQV